MTDMIKAGEAVIKTDKLGRVQTPLARREELLDEFERSGLSGAKFAELTGVKYQTLATWLKKRRRARRERPTLKRPKQLRWLEAVVQSNDNSKTPLVLELAGGAKVYIHDVQQAAMAAALLRALAGSC